jgi:hypothetical protein
MIDKYSYKSLEEIEEAMDDEDKEYCDIQIVDAIRTEDGEYFYKI